MERLWRIVFNSLTWLSVLGGLAVCGLWRRSYRANDSVDRMWVDRSSGSTPRPFHWFFVGVGSRRGCWAIDIVRGEAAERGSVLTSRPWRLDHPRDWDIYTPRGRPDVNRAGFVFERDLSHVSHPDYRYQGLLVVAPDWSLAILLAILPTARLIPILRRRRRRAAGECVVCGYDLRATPNRCPECGTAP